MLECGSLPTGAAISIFFFSRTGTEFRCTKTGILVGILPARSQREMKIPTYEITRWTSGWTRNYPSTDTLNKGDLLITDIYLCDGTWRVSPKLPKRKTVSLQLVGRFTMTAEKNGLLTDAWSTNVWTGQIHSAAVEVHLDQRCIDVLNTVGRR